MNKKELEIISKDLRKDIINCIYNAGSGHPGGSLSVIDIVTYLYFEKMNISVENIKDKNRDIFILSKGHAAPAQYVALAKKDFFPKEDLMSLRKTGSFLQGHPCAEKCPGVEVSTGSLGQGFSNGCGLALSKKMDSLSGNVYVILGDGEIQEGIVWETAMAGAKFKLNNLVAIIDRNRIQLDGRTKEIMEIDPLEEKWNSFGWNVVKCDGHNFDSINDAFNKLHENKPTVIIAETIKGKGVSFMEDNVAWHGVAPSEKEKDMAIAELSK
ncbi:transketolase [Clostridium thermobutyricum]|uniref:transketolase n=1 Tax=Clostridium thermobutyricum TaxID=29372 RepID=UPI003F526822